MDITINLVARKTVLNKAATRAYPIRQVVVTMRDPPHNSDVARLSRPQIRTTRATSHR